MAAYYTPAEDAYLQRKAEERGETIDLILCSDGILRTLEEKSRFDAYANQNPRPALGLSDK